MKRNQHAKEYIFSVFFPWRWSQIQNLCNLVQIQQQVADPMNMDRDTRTQIQRVISPISLTDQGRFLGNRGHKTAMNPTFGSKVRWTASPCLSGCLIESKIVSTPPFDPRVAKVYWIQHLFNVGFLNSCFVLHEWFFIVFFSQIGLSCKKFWYVQTECFETKLKKKSCHAKKTFQYKRFNFVLHLKDHAKCRHSPNYTSIDPR